MSGDNQNCDADERKQQDSRRRSLPARAKSGRGVAAASVGFRRSFISRTHSQENIMTGLAMRTGRRRAWWL